MTFIFKMSAECPRGILQWEVRGELWAGSVDLKAMGCKES